VKTMNKWSDVFDGLWDAIGLFVAGTGSH
jgi:hypothetical protein